MVTLWLIYSSLLEPVLHVTGLYGFLHSKTQTDPWLLSTSRCLLPLSTICVGPNGFPGRSNKA